MAKAASTRPEITGAPDDGDAPPWATVDTSRETSSSLAPTEVVSGEVAEYGPAMQTLVEWLQGKATETDEDTWAGMESIIRQMMDSDSPDEVLREKAPIHGKEFVDKTFMCYGFTLREGEYEEGAPYYAVLDVEVGSPPERRVVTCGGWRVLAQLMKLDEFGDWPMAMVIRGKKTKRGFTALRLENPV